MDQNNSSQKQAKKFTIPREELEISFSRSSGSGGQNVNKVNTKATLKWNVVNSQSLPSSVKDRFLKKYQNKISADGFITLSSDEHRTQHLNIKSVEEKLFKLIESVFIAPKIRKKTAPTKASQKKRVEKKRIHSLTKKLRSKIEI